MSDIFCCSYMKSYKARRLDHQAKFDSFMAWSNESTTTSGDIKNSSDINPPFIVQLVRQVNFGPLESKRYFAPTQGQNGPFIEVQEGDIIMGNFQKLNSFKNFKCDLHNKFFEVNLYQMDPVNKHHWRADVARPAGEIDL